MQAMNQTWSADWPTRLERLLREQGFESVSGFLERHPAEPYVDVVKRIAPWVAAMQLSRLQMQEAKREGTLREAAMDAFARELNWLPEGWIPDSASESRAAAAYAHASTLVELDGESPQFSGQMSEVYDALKALQPPIGWRPSGPNDPLIQEALARGWPT